MLEFFLKILFLIKSKNNKEKRGLARMKLLLVYEKMYDNGIQAHVFCLFWL